MEKNRKMEKLSVGTGFLMAAVMIGYFLIMKFFGLTEVLGLRTVNDLLLIGAVLWAINRYKNKTEGRITYFEGLGIGCIISIIAVTIYTIFVFLYLGTHPAFMEYIKENALMGSYLNPVLATGAVFIEGMVSGLMSSYIIMQYYKHYDEHHKFYEERHRHAHNIE